MKQKKVNTNRGAAILFLIFGLLFFVIVVRFLTVGITGQADGKVLAAEAARKYLFKDTIDAKRGTVYDQNGEVIAEDVSSYSLVAILDKGMTVDPKNPQHVTDPQMTAEKLSKYLDMSEEEIYKILTKKNRFQVEFGKAGKDISIEKKRAIEKLKLPGITFNPSTKRFYPNGTFASHLVGYAQKEEEQKNSKGKMGIEKSYDKELQGIDGNVNFERDKWGYLLPQAEKVVTKPQNGDDIYLTIDKKIQTFIEDALSKVEEKYKPEDMIAIVADPKTGKILGMGQRPSFDAMTREGIEKTWQNLAVESAIEPGSTMKIFTLASAVQEGVFNPNATYQSGEFYVKNVPVPIKDWNYYKDLGKITYLKGVQMSSNVGFANLLDLIGQNTFRKYLDRFQFGVSTNIGLPNEATGKILYRWPIEKYTTTFGQGTTVTPIQMIQAITAVANDGKMMKPYVVDKIVNPNTGEIKSTKPQVVGNPISGDTAKKVRDYLRTTLTDKDGTGIPYNIPGYEVTGKTGTAQISDPNGGGYLEGEENYIFSFLGMAPKDDPQLVVYVAVKQPQLPLVENGNGIRESGSVPVSMIFNPIMKNSLQYLNIKPSKMARPDMIKVPDFSNKSLSEVNADLKAKGLVGVVLGNGGTIIDQQPAKNETLLKGEKVILKTNSSMTIPNMAGWSKRDVLKVADLLELKLNMVGNGFVTKQNINPTSPIKPGDQLVVNFQTPEKTLQLKKANNKQKELNTEPPPKD